MAAKRTRPVKMLPPRDVLIARSQQQRKSKDPAVLFPNLVRNGR
jgi:hypothetical protein